MKALMAETAQVNGEFPANRGRLQQLRELLTSTRSGNPARHRGQRLPVRRPQAGFWNDGATASPRSAGPTPTSSTSTS
ncbi:hypothetical protein ACRAWF_17345 [Streptomyces sp. L7]